MRQYNEPLRGVLGPNGHSPAREFGLMSHQGITVAVLGGGLSGQRAALTLARAGARVTLIEKNRYLGGRAFSFVAPGFGEVDIGQHIWLRACTALEQFLGDLAVP